MIKHKTISKPIEKSKLIEKNTVLERKLQQSCELIKEANYELSVQKRVIDNLRSEIDELKSHWTYKFWGWLKSFTR